MIHVGVLLPRYVEAILAGSKTVESRLSRYRRAPYGVVSPGDAIYFKQRSGPFRVRAIAERVESWEGLGPGDIDELAVRHRREVGAPLAYWRERRQARYATLIWLAGVTPVDHGPAHPPMYGRGWQALARPGGRRAA